MQGVRGNGTVGILGLNTDTIRKWVSVDAPEKNIKKHKAVRVYAGYEKDGDVLDCELFTAQYVGAIPTSPPEMWLNFTVQEANSVLSTEVLSSQGLFLSGTFTPGEHGGTRSPFATKQSYSSSLGTSIHDACRALAQSVVGEQCGYASPKSKSDARKKAESDKDYFLEWCINPELELRLPKLRAVSFASKTPEQAVELINSWKVVRAEWKYDAESYNYGMFGEWQRLRCIPRLVVRPNFKDYKFDTSLKEPFVIDSDAGMIGLPQFGAGLQWNTVKVKCLLRRDIGIGDLIQPVSRYISGPKKYYVVNGISYDGEFRGQNWYVTYDAIGIDSDQEYMEMERKAEEEKKKAEAAKKQAEDEKRKSEFQKAQEKQEATRKMWIAPGKTMNSIAFP